MNQLLSRTIGLLVIAVLVALVARRLRLPYTVGLVVTGIALAVARVGVTVVLTHDFVFDLILPPLLFEAAINIPWRPLVRDALPVLTLAIAGTLISAAVVAAGMMIGLGWPFADARLFGALIAATDPVAVIALFKDHRVGGRLRLLVESESLFNDGVAAVLFSLMLAWPQGGAGLAAALGQVLFTVGAGALCGLACGGAALVLSGNTSDPLVESTLTTLAAYGSFLLANDLGASGVLATVAAGLLMGNLGMMAEGDLISEQGRGFVLGLWDFIAFIANSLVFLVIGLTVGGVSFGRLGAATLCGIVALVLIARACTIYPLCLLFRGSARVIALPQQHVLWWGGLRGALGLALALSLPRTLALRNEILIATFAVVVFSVVAQGLSMPLLLRHLPQRAPE